MHLVLFLIFGAICIGGAINLLAQKHPINSALSLIVVMGSLALLYLLLGAEFVAAVQIIVYAGAVMYADFSNNLDSCIAIRTLVVRGNKGYIQAGGGIVADSVPENEYMETVNKSRALIRAINLAQRGFEI